MYLQQPFLLQFSTRITNQRDRALLAKEEKTTLYSYLDNIIKQHLQQYNAEITQYFNDKFNPIF